MTQQPLFIPGTGGRETPAEPIEARLRHRRTDPAPSVQAAKAIVKKLSAQKRRALDILALRGCGTTWELAAHWTRDPSARTEIHYMLSRRLPELEEDGLVRRCGERERTVMAGGRTYTVWVMR